LNGRVQRHVEDFANKINNTEVDSLSVAPEWQRRGIGTMLLKKVLENVEGSVSCDFLSFYCIVIMGLLTDH